MKDSWDSLKRAKTAFGAGSAVTVSFKGVDHQTTITCLLCANGQTEEHLVLVGTQLGFFSPESVVVRGKPLR